MAIDMDIVNAAMVRHRTPEQAAAAAAANAVHKTELDQDDFLTLMITQLKNQDPMKPLDPSQYVGQLAQFSSVAGLKEVNTAIANLTNSLRGNQVLDGAGMIGRTVIAQGNDVYLGAPAEDRQGIAGAIEVPSGTNSLQLVVRDASGATIKTQAMATTSGMRGFQWDGTTDSGAQAPESLLKPGAQEQVKAVAGAPARERLAKPALRSEPKPFADALRDQAPAAAAPAPEVSSRADTARGELSSATAAAAPRAAPVTPQAAPAQALAKRAMAREEVRLETPERELDRIAQLRRDGRHEDAAKALAEFRKRYPDFMISEAMLERVERR